MIDIYYWPTPNGHKITIFCQEARLEYKVIPVDITKGAQFEDSFLKISPNNKMPAIVDHLPIGGGDPITVFESGAILLYLSEKIGRFGGTNPANRREILQWLMWQVAGFGPMLGQNHHFSHYAKEKVPYAIERYRTETKRLYGVLDHQLAQKEFICGAYSIVDMACYPWVVSHEIQGQDLKEYPNIKRWFEIMKERRGIKRAYALDDKDTQS